MPPIDPAANSAPSFTVGDGKVFTGISSFGEDNGNAMAIQADGKILVAGSTANGSYTDFAPGNGNLVLDHLIFTQLTSAALSGANFASNSSGSPADSDDYIVHDSSSGLISFGPDDNCPDDTVAFASRAAHPTSSSADIMLI